MLERRLTDKRFEPAGTNTARSVFAALSRRSGHARSRGFAKSHRKKAGGAAGSPPKRPSRRSSVRETTPNADTGPRLTRAQRKRMRAEPAPSPAPAVDAFCAAVTEDCGVSVTPRVRRGIDIDAACGQLAYDSLEI